MVVANILWLRCCIYFSEHFIWLCKDQINNRRCSSNNTIPSLSCTDLQQEWGRLATSTAEQFYTAKPIEDLCCIKTFERRQSILIREKREQIFKIFVESNTSFITTKYFPLIPNFLRQSKIVSRYPLKTTSTRNSSKCTVNIYIHQSEASSLPSTKGTVYKKWIYYNWNGIEFLFRFDYRGTKFF